jgi:hypothetical protein
MSSSSKGIKSHHITIWGRNRGRNRRADQLRGAGRRVLLLSIFQESFIVITKESGWIDGSTINSSWFIIGQKIVFIL